MVLTNNFEDGTTQGWGIGNSSAHPNPPANTASGGPDGTDDNFLQTQANGGAGAGSRLAFFNENAEWTGDYTIGDVTGITASANNQGSSDIVLRVALDGAGGQFVTTEGVTLSSGSDWQEVAFSIEAADLTAVGGTDVTATLADVSQIRFINSPTPSYQGSPVPAQLGMDNIATVGGEPGVSPVTPPPTGDLPVVSFDVVPDTFSEEAENNLVEWKWTVTGDFPEEGITVNLNTSGGGGAFAFTEQFAADPPSEFVDSDIVGFDEETGELNILLESPEASFKLYFVDDILEEGVQEFEFVLADGDGYTVDAEMNGGIFTITDDNGGPGVGPTVGLSVSEAELTEGDTFTVSFNVDGDIPSEGVQVLVQSDVPGSLGQFDLADLGNITTTGINGLPEVGDGGGGSFFVTITEPTATITLDVFDDILAEEPLPITFSLANGELYEVAPDADSIALTIADEAQPVGPTVALSADNTELIEGGATFTLTISVDGDIPEGGLPILINDIASAGNATRSLTEFDVGNVTTTGIEGFPAPADGDSGFFVTVTEPTATITLAAFDDGADEDEATEQFNFAVIDGEAYEVDPDASNITASIADPVETPPGGDLPILSFTASPETLNEAEGTALTFNFSVEGDFPEDGIIVRFDENFFDTGDQIDFNIFDLENLEFFDFEETSPGLFTVDYKLSAPEGSLTTGVFDDNVAEADFVYTPSLLPIPDANYTLNPDASSASISIVDGVVGTGGPVINLAVDQTDITEGDPITLTLTAEGEIPEGGIEINVDTGVGGALGDFISTDEGGIPDITATGFSGVPAPNGSASGFSAVMTENTATIAFDVVNDGFAEDTENFDITLLDGENYDVSGASSAVSISDANSSVPVVALEVSPDEITEAEDGPAATLTFTVDGEIPEVEVDAEGNYVSGGLPIEFNGSDVIALFDQITGGPILDGVEVTRFPADETDTTYEFTLLQNTATVTVDILDDVIQEEAQAFSFNIIPSPEGPYAVDPDAFAGSFTLLDGVGGSGVGPTVGISTTETELSEGESFTVNFSVDGDIPAEGVQVLVDSATVGALGEFAIFDEEGNPAVEFEGIAAFPEVGDGGGSSFLVTITEPEASLTLSVFDDGPGEGAESLTFDLVDGEVYEVDPDANSITLNIDDATTTELPVVSVSTPTPVVSEDGDTTLTVTFSVDGDIPEGGLPITVGGDLTSLFDPSLRLLLEAPFVVEPETGLVPVANRDPEFNIALTAPTVSVSFEVFDDILEEDDLTLDFALLEGDGYVVDGDGIASVTVVDGDSVTPGSGPTVSFSASETVLAEGDTFTVSFDVDGEIPEGGLTVFVDGPPAALSEFVIFNEDGSPAVTTEGVDGFPAADNDAGGFFVTLSENQASLSLTVFEDGPTEGPESLTFELINGEEYEVNPEASAVTFDIGDGGEEASFAAESGVTSVFLDFPLLEEVAGLTLVSADSEATPAERPSFLDPFQVGFAITDDTDFSFEPAPFAPLGGSIEHSGTITLGLGDAEATIGEFSIGFDPARVSDTASGFFVADTLDDPLGLEILFDLSAPGTVSVSNNELEISDADLLLSPELAGALGVSDLAGADVGDAQVDALVALTDGGMPGETINGTEGEDHIRGTAGDDVIVALDGDDRVFADPGNDILSGGSGRDRLFGSDGRDILIGDMGNDFLNGGAGDDVLMGVTGRDVLVGGDGADLFVFGVGDGGARNSNALGNDLIRDFEVGIDKIGLVEGELTFADITITQSGSRALLGVASTGEVLAALKGVDASSLSESSFEIVPNVATVEDALTIL